MIVKELIKYVVINEYQKINKWIPAPWNIVWVFSIYINWYIFYNCLLLFLFQEAYSCCLQVAKFIYTQWDWHCMNWSRYTNYLTLMGHLKGSSILRHREQKHSLTRRLSFWSVWCDLWPVILKAVGGEECQPYSLSITLQEDRVSCVFFLYILVTRLFLRKFASFQTTWNQSFLNYNSS